MLLNLSSQRVFGLGLTQGQIIRGRMSKRAKGNRSERKAVKELEEDGWLVYRVKGSTKFNKNVDVFGLFDIIARKDGLTKWVQIKTNKKPVLKPFQEYKYKYCTCPKL